MSRMQCKLLVFALLVQCCLAACVSRRSAERQFVPSPAQSSKTNSGTPSGASVRTELVLEVKETPLLSALLSGVDSASREPCARFTVSKTGMLYVLGGHGDAVYCFQDNHLIRKLPVKGGDAGAARLSSIDVDGKGRLYCWDSRNRQIAILQESGPLLCSAGIRGIGDDYVPDVAVTDAGVLQVRGVPRLLQLTGERLKVIARYEPHLARYDTEGAGCMLVADNGHLYYPMYFPTLTHPWAKGLKWPNVGFLVFTSDMRSIATYEAPVRPVEGDPWLVSTRCSMGADDLGFLYGAEWGTRVPSPDTFSDYFRTPLIRCAPGWALVFAYNPRTRAYFRFQVSHDSWYGMRLGHDGAWYVLTSNWRDQATQRWLRMYRYDVSDLRSAAPDVTTLWRNAREAGR